MKAITGLIQFPHVHIEWPTAREREMMWDGACQGIGFWAVGMPFCLVTVALGAILLRAVEAL